MLEYKKIGNIIYCRKKDSEEEFRIPTNEEYSALLILQQDEYNQLIEKHNKLVLKYNAAKNQGNHILEAMGQDHRYRDRG